MCRKAPITPAWAGQGCPRLWVKREELTPLGAGGNQIRKLEFVLARARTDELEAEGKRLFIIPWFFHRGWGLGSVEYFFELVEQAPARGFTPDAVTVGSPGTVSGFLDGAYALALSGGQAIPILAFDAFGAHYPMHALFAMRRHFG